MAMNKILVIYFLLMFGSLATFGQGVIGFRAVPNGSDGVRSLPAPENKKQLVQKNPRVLIDRNVLGNFFWADPNMPILNLPKDFPSEILIKKLPKDFPSNMPIIGEMSPDMETFFRRWREKAPNIYRKSIPKGEAP
jgi:hypothetical protein